MRASGRLQWIRETGARARIVDLVEQGLLPLLATWDTILVPTDSTLLAAFLDWAWTSREFTDSVRKAYRIDATDDLGPAKVSLSNLVTMWLGGRRFSEIAVSLSLEVDDLIAIYASVVAFNFQTLIEQAVAILGKLLEAQQRILANAVVLFPEYLRFGVPDSCGLLLASAGVRHRTAAVELGKAIKAIEVTPFTRAEILSMAAETLESNASGWSAVTGGLIVNHTAEDLGQIS